MTEDEKIVTIHSTWEDLNNEISDWKSSDPEHPIWVKIRRHPITPQSIQNLLSNGLSVRGSHILNLCGETRWLRERPIITISHKLSPHARDLTLCHELVHAHYTHPEINDPTNFCHKDKILDELIAEWYGRRLRANPKILKALAEQFAGQDPDEDYTFIPYTYDRATFLAFGLHDYDIDKVFNKCPKPLRDLPLLMDPPLEGTLRVPNPIRDEADYEHYEDLLI